MHSEHGTVPFFVSIGAPKGTVPERKQGALAAGVLIVSVALLGSDCAAAQTSAAAFAEKPNIIFLLADDLGYGDVGCYGQKHIQTPNIDRLAQQGTRFTSVYTGASVCAPSRSVLMTGQHVGHTRVRGNEAILGGVGPERRVPLEPEDVTVAQVLKQAGYATGITGKWGLAEPDTAGVPNRKGFDEWFGYLNQRHAHDYYPEYLWRNEEKVTLSGNLGGKRQEYSHDLFTQFALDFVRRHTDQPFFLYVAWTIPHSNYEIPSMEPYADKDWPQDYKVHAAMVTRMDGDVGRLMELLKQLGLDERTIVFFCSDNGAVMRREGVLDSAGPFRATKGTSYEGGVRTPMIVRWPQRVPAGKTSAAVWYFGDFLPTAAALAGTTPPAKIDGLNILPTLLGQPQDLSNRMLYWEQYAREFQQSARWKNWKAIRFGADDKVELYDLSTDVAEEHNIAAEHPDVVKRLLDFMKASHVDSPYWPVDKNAKKEVKKAKKKRPKETKAK